VIRVTISGRTWEFQSAADAIEFERGLQGQPTPSRRRTAMRRAAKRSPNRAKVFLDTNVLTAAFSKSSMDILKAVNDLPADGAVSEKFAHAIGSPNAKAVPPRMMNLGKELKALGYKPADVVIREKTYEKGRAKSVFKAGPKLAEVLRRRDGMGVSMK
jgi:hypothetical protein